MRLASPKTCTPPRRSTHLGGACFLAILDEHAASRVRACDLVGEEWARNKKEEEKKRTKTDTPKGSRRTGGLSEGEI